MLTFIGIVLIIGVIAGVIVIFRLLDQMNGEKKPYRTLLLFTLCFTCLLLLSLILVKREMDSPTKAQYEQVSEPLYRKIN